MTRRGGRAVEPIINDWIAETVTESGWCTATAERTRTVSGKRGKRPDIIVRPAGTGISNRAVIIETETDGNRLEREVEDRLGGVLSNGSVTPSCVIGVLFPDSLAHAKGRGSFRAELEHANLKYFVRDQTNRLPSEGYLEGTISDVVTAARLSMTPKSVVDDYIRTIQNEIIGISGVLADTDDGTKAKIIGILGYNRDQKSVYGMNDEQAGYMAALMILNAGMFYEELAKHLPEISPLSSLGAMPGAPTKHDIITGMNRALDVNYAPVFEVATKLLNAVPDGLAGGIIDAILRAISRVMRLGMQNSGDVYGALYQNDLIERKKSASFYTRPEAATLLAGLVLPPTGDGLWRDASGIAKLRIADFACGTGMLLTAAYNHIINCHGDDGTTARMHPDTMFNMLWGFDIMPTATHLTVSNLASIYPESTFDKSRIYQMPIGTRMPAARSRKPVYALGSLDLIRDADAQMGKRTMVLQVDTLGDGSRAGRRHGGRDSESLTSVRLRTASFDYIIMNPPFVKATNHGAGRTDPVPPFAVFGISPDMQIDMGKINASLFSATGSHGHAGLGSYFAAIGHQKLKPGGVMGFILPATVTSGASWSDIRELLNRWYHNITVVRLRRSAGTDEPTFSASTGMEEIMLVAHKRTTEWPKGRCPRIRFVLLDRLPTSRLEGLEVAKMIRNTTPNKLEHGMGGTSLTLGGTHIGDILDCPVEDGQWMLARTSNIFLLQFAYSLITGKLGVGMTTIGAISGMGKHHLDIIGTKHDGTPQGPFKQIVYDPQKKYQCLWGNNSETQRAMVVSPDCTLEKKSDATTDHVNDVWLTRTHLHINLHVRYTSQRLVAAYTKTETVGGHAWPSVILNNRGHEKALAVWFNSVFGILAYWFVSNSQQIGRGLTTITSCKLIPAPDFGSMDGRTISRLGGVFDDVCRKEMKPINMLDTDQVRQEIDRRVMDILGLEVDNLEQIYGWLVRERQLDRKDLLQMAEADGSVTPDRPARPSKKGTGQRTRSSRGEDGAVLSEAGSTPRGTNLFIPEREDQHNEFKETFSVPVYGGKANDVKMEVAVTVAAFANADGGRLFIGVNDDGEPVGLEKDMGRYGNSSDKLERAIRDFVGSRLEGPVRMKFGFGGGGYLVIDVVRRRRGWVYVGGEFYVREGNRSRKMNAREAAGYQEEYRPV